MSTIFATWSSWIGNPFVVPVLALIVFVVRRQLAWSLCASGFLIMVLGDSFHLTALSWAGIAAAAAGIFLGVRELVKSPESREPVFGTKDHRKKQDSPD